MFRFLAITNRFLCKNRPLIQAVREALDGGVDALMLREPGLDDNLLYIVGKEFSELASNRGIPLLMAGRVDLALALGIDGVHLERGSLPSPVARQVLGRERIIGFSAHSLEEALEAEREGVDYITLSPIFPTRSKPLARPLGLDYLGEVVKSVSLPVLALGGIDDTKVDGVLSRGAFGVAVMSALWRGDPEGLARRISKSLRGEQER